MAAKRYFQHLNPNDDNFQMVTTLEAIDNTDPSFVLYYFDDGTKCNREFIGALNEQDVFGKKEFVEVSSPANKWVFALKPEKPKRQPEQIQTASGEWVEVPSEDQWYSGSQNSFGAGNKSKSNINNYEVKVKPKFVSFSQAADESPVTTETTEEVFNFNDNELTKTKAANAIDAVETHEETAENSKLSYLDANDVDDTIMFVYNGRTYTMEKDQFFTNAITMPEEKIITKEVTKEVVKEVEEGHLEIGLDDIQKNLVDNMIDMSQKEHCDIEMNLTLNLPPMSVYKLIKSVYPKGMSEGFVNIIADRLKTVQLKKAVAVGLLGYYDEDANIEVAENVESESVTDLKEDTEAPLIKAAEKKAKKQSKKS